MAIVATKDRAPSASPRQLDPHQPFEQLPRNLLPPKRSVLADDRKRIVISSTLRQVSKYRWVPHPWQPRVCMIERPKIPRLGGAPGCHGRPCSPQPQQLAPRRAADASGPRLSQQEPVTRSGADRIRSPVMVGRSPPSAERCPPVAPPRRPPTAVVRGPGRSAAAGWDRPGVRETGARCSARC
jgi:hypothetical protein